MTIECNGDWCVAGDCDSHRVIDELNALNKKLLDEIQALAIEWVGAR